MKRILLALLCCAPLLAAAAPMTNDDVVKMVKGGLGEATVIQAIKSGEPGFDTSADGLIKLKQGGVNDKIIQEIIGRGSAPAAKPRKTGAGTATGAVIGGVLGYAIGGHGNRGVGTAVGAAGGAVAGNVYENRASENKTYEIGVLFDDGSSRSFHQDSHPAWKQGSRVKLVNGGLQSL